MFQFLHTILIYVTDTTISFSPLQLEKHVRSRIYTLRSSFRRIWFYDSFRSYSM